MAEPVTATETIRTGLSAAEAQERVATHLGSSVKQSEPGTLVARSGSRLVIRLLGAYLMPRAMMPARTTVEFAPSGAGCEARITCQDDFGFGIRTGMRARYQGLLEAKITEIRQALDVSSGKA